MNNIMNYDPNLTSSGRMASQTVRLTFGLWEYRVSSDVEVGGNCTGLYVIECAIGSFLDSLPNDDFGNPMIVMVNGNGEELECADDEGRREDWLSDMLVSAEIISIEKEGQQ